MVAGVGDVFKALADPTRRIILDELAGRNGQTLFEICARLITNHGLGSSRQAISQHLDVLEAAGLVETRRKGRYKFHYINTRPLEPIIERWLSMPGKDAAALTAAPIRMGRGTGMRINIASVLVDNQEKALRFYTEMLGFVKKHDVPVGEDRWLTVVSPQDPDGTELLLEPSGHPAVKPFKEALVADGIPYTQFAVDDVKAEYERLRGLGVRFTQEPADMGPVTTAVLDDTCGNLIQIAHQAS
jgi:DNA-binding transcriptional ArsR family regulator